MPGQHGHDPVDPVSNYRKRKMWIKVPPGHSLMEPPSKGGVEHHMVSVVEPPVCCGGTPAPVEDDTFSERQCKPCGARWYP